MHHLPGNDRLGAQRLANQRYQRVGHIQRVGAQVDDERPRAGQRLPDLGEVLA